MNRLPRPHAIAFDCYGTLLDVTDEHFIAACGTILSATRSEHDRRAFWDLWLAASRTLAREAGRDSDDPLAGPEPEFQSFRARWPQTFERAFADAQIRGDIDAAYEAFHLTLCDGVAYPDTAPALARLRPHFRLSVVSNADEDHLLHALTANGLTEFEFILSSETAGSYKPRAPIFQQAAVRFGLDPHAVLYVGDSPMADLLGARAAGMQVAWINRSGATLPERIPAPDYEIAALTELADLLVPAATRVQDRAGRA